MPYEDPPGRAAIVAAAALAAVGVLTAPAQAHPASGINWSSNHTICDGCSVSRGNIVAMWQSILVSSVGGLGDCYTWVDGVFGSHTATATHTWQTAHHIKSDGVVGSQTWTTAFNLLIFDHLAAGYYFYTYNGGHGVVWFRRSAITSVWDFAGGIAPLSDTNHPGITQHSCIGVSS